MNAGSLALAFSAALAGSGLYANLVEQPARLALEDAAILSEWGPSDRRGVALNLGLSLIAGALGITAFSEIGDARWAIGAVFALLTWPFNFFVMAPLNNQILTLAPRNVGAARALVRQWGLLEWGQTGIGLAATAIFLAVP